MENILSLSGGATKFIGILSAAKTVLESGFKPSIILGVSSGAYAALPLALGKTDKAIEIGLNITLDSFFKRKPVNECGKQTFNAYGRIITGKESLGVQDARKLLADVISQSDFEHYKMNPKYPEIYVLSVDYNKGERKLWKLRDLNYMEMLNAVEASSRVPIITQAQIIDNVRYYDGGVCDHNCASWFISEYDVEVNELVSIYSRPKDFKVNNEWDIKSPNLFQVIERTLEIMNIEISKNDEQREIDLQLQKKFKLTQIFLPKVLNSLYDVDKGRLKELHDFGIKIAKNTYK